VSVRAVFLDRDGVINRAIVREGKPYPPATLGELEVLPGVSDALRDLKARGYALIVVTNQPDVARGTLRAEDVAAIHAHLGATLPIDAFFVCFHDSGDHCNCRKPRPGMLLEAARRHDIDLARSYMVGDRWRDVDAGNAAGVRAFLVDYGYDEQQPAGPFRRVRSLREAADAIMNDEGDA
jgi:D-glycero-D-manno-heptose 1,7-bisphosphate phosphatase